MAKCILYKIQYFSFKFEHFLYLLSVDISVRLVGLKFSYWLFQVVPAILFLIVLAFA